MSETVFYNILDTTRNEKELLSRKPNSGRMIKEDFSVVNWADLFAESGGDLAVRVSLGTGTITLSSLILTGDLTVQGNFNFGDATTDLLKVNGQLQLANGLVTAPSLGFQLEPTTGIYKPVAGVLGIAILGVDVVAINSTGILTNNIGALTGEILSTTSRISQNYTKTLASEPNIAGLIFNHVINGVGDYIGSIIGLKSGGLTGEFEAQVIEIDANVGDDGGNIYSGTRYVYSANGALGTATAITVDEGWDYALQIYAGGGIRSNNQEFVIDNYRTTDAGDGAGYDTHIYGGSPLGVSAYSAGNLIFELFAPAGAGTEGGFIFKRQGATIATIDATGGADFNGTVTIGSASISTNGNVSFGTISGAGIFTKAGVAGSVTFRGTIANGGGIATYIKSLNTLATAGDKITSFDNGGVEVAYVDYQGRMAVGDGTVSLPAYSFKSDPDTGMYLSGSNALSWSLGGTSFMGLTSAGLFSNAIQPLTSAGATSLQLNGRWADSASAVSAVIGNWADVAYTQAGAKILSMKNGGVEVAYVDYQGRMLAGDGTQALPAFSFKSDPDSGFYKNTGNSIALSEGGAQIYKWQAGVFYTAKIAGNGGGAGQLTVQGLMVDGASAIGVTINAGTSLTTPGAKIASFQNATAEKAFIDYQGGLISGVSGVGAVSRFYSSSATGTNTHLRISGDVSDTRLRFVTNASPDTSIGEWFVGTGSMVFYIPSGAGRSLNFWQAETTKDINLTVGGVSDYRVTAGLKDVTLSPSTTGTINLTGSQTVKVTTVNVATYDLLPNDYILSITYTVTGAVTSLTLPTAQTVAGRTINIKDAGGNAGTNSITVDTEGAQTIDGSATAVINGDYDGLTLYCDGSNWFIVK